MHKVIINIIYMLLKFNIIHKCIEMEILSSVRFYKVANDEF